MHLRSWHGFSGPRGNFLVNVVVPRHLHAALKSETASEGVSLPELILTAFFVPTTEEKTRLFFVFLSWVGNMKRGRAIVQWLKSRPVGRLFLENPHVLGLRGETIACRELKRRGYTIVERRVRGRLGEIDIVAWDGPVLVVVEVKTRSGARFGSPAEAVGRRKQKKLVALAHAYLARKGLAQAPVRFDVVSVVLRPGRKPKVEVFQGAFQEG